MIAPRHCPPPENLHRLPGLFRRWELAQVLEAGADYRIEDAGAAADGTPLLAIYRSDGALTGAAEVV